MVAEDRYQCTLLNIVAAVANLYTYRLTVNAIQAVQDAPPPCEESPGGMYAVDFLEGSTEVSRERAPPQCHSGGS